MPIADQILLPLLLTLALLLAAWIVCLELALRKSREASAALQKALRRIAEGGAGVRMVGGQVEVKLLKGSRSWEET